jgi:hypothetical protein
MNEINMLSILNGDLYEYKSNERPRCWICSYDTDNTVHDISRIICESGGNIFISDYSAARCKDICVTYEIGAVLNVSNNSYEPFTFNYL